MTNSISKNIKILSNAKEIEKNKKITLAIKGRGITIDGLAISPTSIEIYFISGEVKSVQATTEEDKAKFKAIYNQILSDLKRGKIHSNEEYHYRDFSETYQISNLITSRKNTESQSPIAENDNESVQESRSAKLLDFARSSKKEKEHLESTTQKIREYNARHIYTSTPLRQMESDTESPSNVTHFGPRQNISERSILGYNDTTEPTPVPTPLKQMENDTESPNNGIPRQNISERPILGYNDTTEPTPVPTLSKQMEDGTLNNGEVSIPFGPRKNISGHNIRILNSNDTAEPTPVPQDSAGGSSLAAAISFGILLGLIGSVVLVGLGAAYYMRKRSGSYDANKWNNSEFPEASTETNTSPKLSRLESIKEELEGRSSTDLPEEANPLLPKASTGIINPPAKPSRLERIQKEDHATEVIDSSSTTEQLAEVVVHEGQQGAEGQIPMSELEMDLLQKAASSARSKRHVTRDSEGPYSSLTELGNVTKKSDNNLRRASS